MNEIINPTQNRVDNVMVGAIATAFSVFIVVAVAGFITYGDAVDSDVLQSYPGAFFFCVFLNSSFH